MQTVKFQGCNEWTGAQHKTTSADSAFDSNRFNLYAGTSFDHLQGNKINFGLQCPLLEGK